MQTASTAESLSGAAAGRWTDVADLAGRIALAAIFVMSGASKLFAHTTETVQMMAAYGVPLAGLLIYPAAIAELVGGLALAAGYQTKLAALVLALYTAGITPIFHAFWAAPADQTALQMIQFMKNVGLFGGLLHVVARGTGRSTLQRAMVRRTKTHPHEPQTNGDIAGVTCPHFCVPVMRTPTACWAGTSSRVATLPSLSVAPIKIPWRLCRSVGNLGFQSPGRR